MSAIALGGIAAVPSYFGMLVARQDAPRRLARRRRGARPRRHGRRAADRRLRAEEPERRRRRPAVRQSRRSWGSRPRPSAAAIVYSGVVSFVLLKIVGADRSRCAPTREDESVGLDLSQHGEEACHGGSAEGSPTSGHVDGTVAGFRTNFTEGIRSHGLKGDWVKRFGAIREWSMTARERQTASCRTPSGDVRQSGVQRHVQQAAAAASGVSGAAADDHPRRAARCSVADAVATAMKDWAVEHGATHYTHWFQPLTGITAEKHDSFLSAEQRQRRQGGGGILRQGTDSRRARCLELSVRRHALHLRGARLHGVGSDQPAVAAVQRRRGHAGRFRPRSSAGPAKRSTRRRRCCARWKRSSKQAVRVLKLFGSTAERVVATCGPEQEYFLDRRYFYLSRPDLINAGRTLFGAKPPKGQELEDQYFGAIPDRVMAFMSEVESELYKVGVPVKTRHNEVAPSQYEIAPVFENANLATDHQMMTMETMRRIGAEVRARVPAAREAVCRRQRLGQAPELVDERRRGAQPAQPGRQRRTTICSSWCSAPRCCARSTSGRGCCGRASPAPATITASARTKRRRRSSRSSSATCSPTSSSRSRRAARNRPSSGGMLDTGVLVLPKLPRDAGDRNRTSPFAFTGNKFEFRAVASNQSIAYPNIALNIAVTESLDYDRDRARSRRSRGARRSRRRSPSCCRS